MYIFIQSYIKLGRIYKYIYIYNVKLRLSINVTYCPQLSPTLYQNNIIDHKGTSTKKNINRSMLPKKG